MFYQLLTNRCFSQLTFFVSLCWRITQCCQAFLCLLPTWPMHIISQSWYTAALYFLASCLFNAGFLFSLWNSPIHRWTISASLNSSKWMEALLYRFVRLFCIMVYKASFTNTQNTRTIITSVQSVGLQNLFQLVMSSYSRYSHGHIKFILSCHFILICSITAQIGQRKRIDYVWF